MRSVDVSRVGWVPRHLRVAPAGMCRLGLLLLAMVCFAARTTPAGDIFEGVVCIVDGKSVLWSEVAVFIGKKNPTKEEWERACRELIIQKLVERIAEEKDIKVTDKEVEKRLMQRLKATGITLEDAKEELAIYQREMRQWLIRAMVIKKEMKKPTVLPAEVKAYYDEHIEEFRVAERRRVRMISAIIDKTAEPEAARKAAREKIESVMQQLKEKKDFVLLATRNSNDPYAEKGGDWGMKEKGDLLEPLDKAAFSLEVLQVSDIIETPRGFHIIRIDERQPGYDRQFNEVGEEIKRNLAAKRFTEEVTKYLDSLIDNATIKYYDKGPEK